MRAQSRFIWSIGILLFIVSCTPQEQSEHGIEKSYVFGGPAQGTSYMVKYHGKGLTDYQSEVDSILLVIDQSLSTYVEQSTVSRFNRQNELVTNDQHFIKMVFDSKEIRDLSGGAFDPAVMPLVRAWGFGPEGPQNKVDSVAVDSLLKLIDWNFDVVFSNETKSGANRSSTIEITKNAPVEFDFNGIAQGYTVDVIFDFLVSRGVEDLMVEVGGEIRARGLSTTEDPWTIGIDQPDEYSQRGSQAVLSLIDRAVATSGSYRKFYERDGEKFSHTIDPTTGYPVSHQLLSATVVAPTALKADAYATVFMVLGPEKSQTFLASDAGSELDAYLIYTGDDGNLKTFTSVGLKEILSEKEDDSVQ